MYFKIVYKHLEVTVIVANSSKIFDRVAHDMVSEVFIVPFIDPFIQSN